MKRQTILGLWAILSCLGVVNAFSHLDVRQFRQGLLYRYESPGSYLPAELASIIAGEFKGLTADFLLLEIGSFVGSNQKPTQADYRNIYLALKQAMALDPYFQQTYLYVQGNLPWEAKMPKEAIDLLKIARANRPWDWGPGQYIGFDYYYFLNDYAQASEAFLEAGEIKDAPAILAVLGGRFALKGNRTEAAVRLLKEMLEDKGINENKKKDINQRLEALNGIMHIERAIENYKAQYGGSPDSLGDLVTKGIVSKLPENPYGNPYYYNPENGKITFDKIN